MILCESKQLMLIENHLYWIKSVNFSNHTYLEPVSFFKPSIFILILEFFWKLHNRLWSLIFGLYVLLVNFDMTIFQTVMQSLHFLKLTLSSEVRNTLWKEKIMWCKSNKWEKLFAFLVSWVLTYHHQWDPFGFLEMYSCKNLNIVTFLTRP